MTLSRLESEITCTSYFFHKPGFLVVPVMFYSSKEDVGIVPMAKL